MLYTIYKITNLINDKFYIGMHKTNHLDDGYMGSGKLIKASIKKYGIENFHKEILHVYDNEEDMKNKEKELVVLSEMSYNLCEGGKGGFGYINGSMKEQMNKLKSELQKAKPRSYYQNLGFCAKEVSSLRMTKMHQEGKVSAPSWIGKKHTEDTKQKMRKPKNVGSDNPQFGTCWVKNEQESIRIKKHELPDYLKLGYVQGRTMNTVVYLRGRALS